MSKRVAWFILFVCCVSMLYAEKVEIAQEKENQVQFTASATFGDVVGTTDAIEGYVQWQDEDWTHQSEFSFKVDLATLDTGIGLRNKHMRNKYLETETYPYATYKGQITQVTDNDSLWNVQTTGTLSIHGVERQVEISGQVLDSSNGYHVKANFELDLEDFNIKQPRFLLATMSKRITLDIGFYTTKATE